MAIYEPMKHFVVLLMEYLVGQFVSVVCKELGIIGLEQSHYVVD